MTACSSWLANMIGTEDRRQTAQNRNPLFEFGRGTARGFIVCVTAGGFIDCGTVEP